MARQRLAAVIEAGAAQQGRDEAESGKGKPHADAGHIVPLKCENPDACQQPEHGINQREGTGYSKKVWSCKGGLCSAVNGITLSTLSFPVRPAFRLKKLPFQTYP